MRLVLGSSGADVLTVTIGAVGDELGCRVVVLRSVETRLDDLLALSERNHGLQLGRGEGVHVAGLARDEHQRLRTRQGGQLVRLMSAGQQTIRP